MSTHSLLNHRGATMVELMAALAILSLGITALLQTLGGGIRYANDTENNIKAINLVREGIEATLNIRDTNWLRFSSDRINCWVVKDYQTSCIGNAAPPLGVLLVDGSYTLVSTNGVWFLSGSNSALNPISNWSAYKQEFKVGIDSAGFYTQTGIVTATPCSSTQQKSCLTIFTREIQLTISAGTMVIRSISRWNQERPRNVTFETTVTNWKSRF